MGMDESDYRKGWANEGTLIRGRQKISIYSVSSPYMEFIFLKSWNFVGFIFRGQLVQSIILQLRIQVDS